MLHFGPLWNGVLSLIFLLLLWWHRGRLQFLHGANDPKSSCSCLCSHNQTQSVLFINMRLKHQLWRPAKDHQQRNHLKHVLSAFSLNVHYKSTMIRSYYAPLCTPFPFFNVGMNHVTKEQIGAFLLPLPPFITTERQFEETAALASPSDNPNTIPLYI